MSRRAMVTVAFALTIGPAVRAPFRPGDTGCRDECDEDHRDGDGQHHDLSVRAAARFDQRMVFHAATYERRSADQVPEHSPEPAVQIPEPSVADMRPVPVALWLPRDTVTVTAPLLPTEPEILNAAVPA